ncbi:hypothetical protein [Rhizorhapis sp. SPR117]|uniref:hypothetical protein n=1 Tax=Rhizorhapis sp. SPR117 TaxID=2912611 RepID=UPI001F33141E|nr:hypothetical protein [Rhizorhapis sp. SPR117]
MKIPGQLSAEINTEAAWRALASAVPGLSEGAANRPLIDVYKSRIIPPALPEPPFYRLDPLELAAGLRVDHPDAFFDDDAIGARIHTLECLKGIDDFYFPVAPDELTDAGWRAAVAAMPKPVGTTIWSPALLRQRRAIAGRDAVEERAWSAIAELHSAICVLHEAPFSAGLDFATYLTDLINRLRDNPVSVAQLQAADAEFYQRYHDLTLDSDAIGMAAATMMKALADEARRRGRKPGPRIAIFADEEEMLKREGGIGSNVDPIPGDSDPSPELSPPD